MTHALSRPIALKPPRRSGFTLVELLVAMALAIVILSLAVVVSNSAMFESYKVVGAGDRLSQWMITAKNRALRDKAPRGIRLSTDERGRLSVVQYIEVPETKLYAPPAAQNPDPSNMIGFHLVYYRTDTEPTVPDNKKFVYISFPNNAAGIAMRDEFVSTSGAGDVVQVPEKNWMLRLTSAATAVASANTAGNIGPTTLAAGSPLARLNVETTHLPNLGAAYSKQNATNHTPTFSYFSDPNLLPTTNGKPASFSVTPAPRPLLGEPPMALPDTMVVDVAASLNYSSDILFSPSGEVVGATTGLTVLALRDITKLPNPTGNLLQSTSDFNKAGEVILIAVYSRTGAIATQPVNPPPASPDPAPSHDPYRFAKDGVNSGF
ncbi:MAG: pilus assembly FimT family protein [Gemmataceae bacterium]